MKYIIEKYTKGSRIFNLDIEVTQSMVDAVECVYIAEILKICNIEVGSECQII